MDTQHTIPTAPSSAIYPSGYSPVMPPPTQDFFTTRSEPLRTYSIESANSYADMEDSNQTIIPQPRSQRSRRRHQLNPEHVKHRRTRSGCYTCRQRRVKCDETQPVCDRCRKGNRECAYPDSTSIPSKQARSTIKTKSLSVDSESSPSGDEADGYKNDISLAVPSRNTGATHDESEARSATTEYSVEDEANHADTSISPQPNDQTSATFFQHQKSVTNPSTTGRYDYYHVNRSVKWFFLPRDVRLLLEYHGNRLCHYHYAFRSDHNDFLKTTFLEIAVNDEDEALLYAVVAFAAYHRTFAQEDSGICNFLAYYNRSINLLQQSLKQPNTTTLLTILQLATIEEFLGDWVNLMGHQKACYQLITDLFEPQTIMANELQRQILRWYLRFDVFAGTLSGGGNSLGYEWFEASREYHSQVARDRSNDFGAKAEEYFSTNRVLAAELSELMSTTFRTEANHEQFEKEGRRLIEKVKAHERELASAYTSAPTPANEFPETSPLIDVITNNSPFGPDQSMRSYSGDSFVMNFVLLDFWNAEIMIRKQISGQNTADLEAIAFKQCKIIDAIACSEEAPKGALLPCHAPIGLASLFLPRNEDCIDWSRRMFAALEQLGYIYPAALRERMSSMWGVDVRDAWLPDQATHPAALQHVREFIDYRKTVPEAALDVQIDHMNGILSTLWSDIRRMNAS